MPKDQFDFKLFSIHQDKCAMKVGTDGVLLGAWATAGDEASEKNILDIGAGTGLISLMLAQRYKHALITAVEIDQEAAAQCQENIASSPWSSRITVLPHSLQDAESKLLSTIRFDCIISNPPFYNATLKPEDEGRAIARHKDSLPVEEIAAFSQRWLSPSGSLSLIYPIAYDSEVMTAAILHGLQPSRICDVLTKAGKACKRRMATFVRQGGSSMINREQLTIRNENGGYSEEYRHLVEDFYLSLKD